MKEHKGSLIASGLRFAVVVARFNETFTRRLLTGAVETLERILADFTAFARPGCCGSHPRQALPDRSHGAFDTPASCSIAVIVDFAAVRIWLESFRPRRIATRI